MKYDSRPELLSPAGSYEGMLAALSAGADAVYAGGRAFGARANAVNFTDEELLRAIDYTNLHDKKLYLTVNTLCKDREIEELFAYLTPLYEQGLAGVIVQDLGIINILKNYFPGLLIHASTQMTITSSRGAELLKSLGAERIVPSRELSLEEIKAIKSETDIELECFIHGAMCYSYSGACLFSSFLGGRSGNRGRCAQPCRLPYTLYENGKAINSQREQYILSMKDMCTVDILPELIEAGIDSFKIEGRMKKSDYTYNVTGIYRKYIDKYLESDKKYQVSREDMALLRASYVRTDTESGYYHKRNGRSLITLKKPSYESSLEGTAFNLSLPKIKIKGSAELFLGQAAHLSLESGNIRISQKEGCVQAAQKSPVEEEKLRERLQKTGESNFCFEELKIKCGDNIFIPMGVINELRRNALLKLQEAILSPYRRKLTESLSCRDISAKKPFKPYEQCFTVLAENREQLLAAAEYSDRLSRIYIELSAIVRDPGDFKEFFENAAIAKKLFIALPYIYRKKDEKPLKEILNRVPFNMAAGFLLRNYEELDIAADPCYKDKILVSDFGLYSFNAYAAGFLKDKGIAFLSAPLELNLHELKERGYMEDTELLYYGNIPLMLTAGCTHKTTSGSCYGSNEKGKAYLLDRYNKSFAIISDCCFCYNRILNSLPICLEREKESIKKLKPGYLRLQFSTEDAGECKRLLGGLIKGYYEADGTYMTEEFSKGHFRKPVE